MEVTFQVIEMYEELLKHMMYLKEKLIENDLSLEKLKQQIEELKQYEQ